MMIYLFLMLAISVEGELMYMDQVCQDNGPLLDCSDVGDGDFAMKTENMDI